VRTRLFHAVVGVAVAVVPACSSGEAPHDGADALTDAVIETSRVEDAAVDTSIDTSTDTILPDTTDGASDSGADTGIADVADTHFTDAPTDADADTGWNPTK
jgi:hypothetical protein